MTKPTDNTTDESFFSWLMFGDVDEQLERPDDTLTDIFRLRRCQHLQQQMTQDGRELVCICGRHDLPHFDLASIGEE